MGFRAYNHTHWARAGTQLGPLRLLYLTLHLTCSIAIPAFSGLPGTAVRGGRKLCSYTLAPCSYGHRPVALQDAKFDPVS